MREKNIAGVVASIGAIAIAVNSGAALAQTNFERRAEAIREAMILGGCWPTQAAKAREVLATLDQRGAQGLVLYSSEERIPATLQAIRSSNLPSLYLVSCGWGMNAEDYRFTGYYYTELQNIRINPPPRVERERRITGEDIITTPSVIVYHLSKTNR